MPPPQQKCEVPSLGEPGAMQAETRQNEKELAEERRGEGIPGRANSIYEALERTSCMLDLLVFRTPGAQSETGSDKDCELPDGGNGSCIS